MASMQVAKKLAEDKRGRMATTSESQRCDYRAILKEELDSRCEQNPRYSLRAFARDLSLAPSRLSEILNHKQGLSRQAAEKIADKLGYHHDEKDTFLDLVTANHARNKKDREYAKIRLLKNQLEHEKFYQLRVDSFKIISDWYHLGILELIQIKGFRLEPEWIAKKLKITPIQVELAIDRLKRVKLITFQNGRLIPTTTAGWIQSDIPSSSIRKFHRQILNKAENALLEQKIEEREFTANLLTINKKNLPDAKNEIRKFQQRFCEDLKETEIKDGLYCLAIQFFSLTEEGI